MSEMVDRVALAVCKEWQASGNLVGSYLDCETVARAAIAAMREPTEAMANAVWNLENWCIAANDVTASDLTDIWHTMIDGALK